MFDVRPGGIVMFPTAPSVNLWEVAEAAAPLAMRSAWEVVSKGRSIAIVIGADDKVHLCRRLRQARRVVGAKGVIFWAAPRKTNQPERYYLHRLPATSPLLGREWPRNAFREEYPDVFGPKRS